jgi:PAS domain S-box-containing protein
MSETVQRALDTTANGEQSFRQIVDSMPAFAWCASPDGKLEYLNRRIVDYTGERQENLVGFGWANVLHSEDVERTKTAWLHSVETGDPCIVDQRVRRFDNVYRWFRTVAQPLRDDSGRVIRWYGVATDIEDWKRAEEAVRASELNFRVIIDSIPGLVHTLTAAGEVEFVNQQNLAYFGKTLEELRGWASGGVFHPDDLARAMEAWKNTQETGQPDEIECRLRRADGVYRWFQLRCLPLRDSQGSIIRWMSLHTDIDERKQAEDRLQLLLDVTNQVVSNLQLSDLLRAISGSIRRVMQCDCASLALPDAEDKQLQLHVLDFPGGKGFFQEEGVYSIEGSPYGTAFRSMKPLALSSPFAEWLDNSVVQNRISDGFKSLCFIPLISRNRAIGTLNLGRLQGDVFTDEDLSFVGQVASQIAIAIENTSAYREVEQGRAELGKALGEIKQRTEALRRSEGYLAEAQKLNHTGSWAWDVRTRDAFWSQEMFKILGYEPEKTKPSLSNFMERVHPEDRQMVEQVVKREVTGSDQDVVSDYRIVLPDRTKKHLHVIAHPVTNESGEVIQVIGTSMDVTEQVEARNKLEKAFAEIKLLKDQLYKENLALRDEVDGISMFEEVVGSSSSLKAVLDSVRIVAPADSTVLIQGETGTGKEMIARAIHKLSPRKDQAFVKVNCAAIPLGLLESELFGHERGAFTGAIAQKVGRFELAHKGTLFLDEVGDIPLELQPKLLRVLQEQEFERLGSTRTQRVDVRVLAATNVSLTQMVAEKKFRSDLYYRLRVFPIDVPPLRDRREDIPLLVRYFSNKYARRMGKHIESIPRESMDALSRYPWPGNIRELQNLMERATLLTTGPSLRVPLAEILTDSGVSAPSEGNALEQAEREQIVRALRESNWVVGGARGAAARLGLKRTSLAYKMQKLRISRPPQ